MFGSVERGGGEVTSSICRPSKFDRMLRVSARVSRDCVSYQHWDDDNSHLFRGERMRRLGLRHSEAPGRSRVLSVGRSHGTRQLGTGLRSHIRTTSLLLPARYFHHLYTRLYNVHTSAPPASSFQQDTSTTFI